MNSNWPTFSDIVDAYSNCRMGKPFSCHQMRFESRLGENLLSLDHDIRTRNYRPSRSVSFIVTKPKPREIFAAHFRDRIVHHLIVSKMDPIFERKFAFANFACRTGKGNHAAVKHFQKMVRRLSQGGVREVWVLQLDIASFFVTIRRDILLDLFLKESPSEPVSYLLEATFSHDARNNTLIQGHSGERRLITREKSWLSRGPEEGIPIGNLTSQLGANVYLNGVDHFILRELKPAGYLRYMDDLTFVDTDPEKLSSLIEPVSQWLERERFQTLNPQKTTLKKLRDGIDYLGFHIRQIDNPSEPAQVFIPRKKKWEFTQALRSIEKSGLPKPYYYHPLAPGSSHQEATRILSSINARLSHLTHGHSFILRKKSLGKIDGTIKHFWRRLKIKNDFTSVRIK